MTFSLPTKCRYRLFGTVLQEKVGTIYDHPQLSMSSSLSGITADTRVVASQSNGGLQCLFCIVL